MVQTATGKLVCSLAWLMQETIDLSTLREKGTQAVSNDLASGSSGTDGEIDFAWSDQRTLGGGASELLEMRSLPATSYLGETVNVGFATVMAVLIENLNIGSGEDLAVGGSGAGSWDQPFVGDDFADIECPAKSVLLFTNLREGWPTTGGDDLQILNQHGSNAVTYRIAILGRKL